MQFMHGSCLTCEWKAMGSLGWRGGALLRMGVLKGGLAGRGK